MNELGQLLVEQLVRDLSALPSALRPAARRRRRLQRCLDIHDLRALAKRAVPRAMFDFVDGAAGNEVTARRNNQDFGKLVLRPRALTDVSTIDLRTTVLGHPVGVPILGAPTGLTGLVHPLGEVGIAAGVQRSGGVYVLSAMASCTIEEVAQAAPGPTWLQVYLWRDRGLVRELIGRARAAGFLALVLTVDVPRAGPRYRDVRNGFGIPPRVTLASLLGGLRRPGWSAGFVRRPRMTIGNAADRGGGPSDPVSLTRYIDEQFDPSLSWKDLQWLRELWDGPLAVKGILRSEDAERAVQIGADAVIVSNHGGRQLDHVASAISALPGVVDAVGAGAEVYLDGGVRRGTDVAKAVALGARACLVGRPLVYGLGAAGEAGAQRAMQILIDELRLTLTLLGCRRAADLDGDWVASVGPESHPSPAARDGAPGL